jgi:hypothetical protein
MAPSREIAPHEGRRPKTPWFPAGPVILPPLDYQDQLRSEELMTYVSDPIVSSNQEYAPIEAPGPLEDEEGCWYPSPRGLKGESWSTQSAVAVSPLAN